MDISIQCKVDLFHRLLDKTYMLTRSRATADVESMMTKMAGRMLDRKLKLERVEACLNCKNFVKCDDIGRFEECADFKEVEGEAWTTRNL